MADSAKFTSYKFILDLLQFPKYITVGPISYNGETEEVSFIFL